MDIGKLMQQLEKSDNTRSNTEEKLKELQKELSKCILEQLKLYYFLSIADLPVVSSLNLSLWTIRERSEDDGNCNCLFHFSSEQ